MYLKLLNDAIMRKKGEESVEAKVVPQSSLQVDAYIPTAYVTKSDKIDIYQSIDKATTEAEVDVITSTVRDIWSFTRRSKLLLRKRKIDIKLAGEEFEKMFETTKQINIYLSTKFTAVDGIGVTLFQNLAPLMKQLKFKLVQKQFKITLNKDKEWFDTYETLISIIKETYDPYRATK